MKTITLTIAFLITLTLTAQEEKVKGIYYTEDNDSKVKIFKATNGQYYGKFVWLEHADKKDVNNPDPNKQDTPLLGMIFMKDFSYNTKIEKWEDGQIYDPKSGKIYECYIWFENNKDELHIRGFVMGMKMLGRTTVWTRIPE